MDIFNLDFHLIGPLAWLFVAIIFAVIEGFTLGLTTIWFTIGSVAAGIASYFGAPFYLQIIIFIVVSLIFLVLTRPIAKKKLNLGKSKDITEAIIDKIALVTTEIAPFQQGQVKLEGKIWSAISEDLETVIGVGKEVKVVRIEGVKLIVTLPVEEGKGE